MSLYPTIVSVIISLVEIFYTYCIIDMRVLTSCKTVFSVATIVCGTLGSILIASLRSKCFL